MQDVRFSKRTYTYIYILYNHLDVVPSVVVQLSGVQVGPELRARQTDAGHLVARLQVGRLERAGNDVMQQQLKTIGTATRLGVLG